MGSGGIGSMPSRGGRAVTGRARAFRSNRSRAIALLASAIGTLLFSVPILQMFKPGSAHWPAFLLSGDIRMQLFPQYVYGYFRFWHGGISGVDFATDAGASVFGLRPNMLQFYPPYIVSYLFFDASNPLTSAAVLSVLQLLHMALALYFMIRLGTRFLSLSLGGSVLLAFMYSLSYTTCQYYFFFLYFFQISLMPIVAYALCHLMFCRRIRSAILMTPLFLTYLLTNYGPTLAMGLIVALTIMGAVFAMRLRPRLRGRSYRRLILPFASLGIAAAVVAPLYIGEQIYHDLASTVPRDVETTAFSGSFNGVDLATAFSWMIPGATATEGSLHWGLLPPLILFLGLLVLVGHRAAPTRLRPVLFSALAIFSCFVFISFGRATIGSDIFYTLVPILGSMHLFQRYTMFGQFFLWLPVAIAAQVFVFQASSQLRQTTFIVVTGCWIIGTLAFGLSADFAKTYNVSWLLTEGFVFFAGALIFIFGRSSLALAALALPIAATSLWPVYEETRSAGVPEFWKTHLDYDKDKLDQLSKLFDAGDDKVLSKVLDLTSDIDSYIPRNEPWILFARKPVMSFVGYEPHLSMDKSYIEMMGYLYGRYDRNWVLQTGVNTVIWDAASELNLKALTADTVSIDSTTPIGDGHFVSRLRYAAPVATGSVLPIVSLQESTPELWKPSPLDNWKMVGGRAMKMPNGAAGSFSIPISPVPGRNYEVTIRMVQSTRGYLTLSFGNTAFPEQLPGSKPGVYTRQYVAKEPGGLWVNASPDFDGGVTDIVVAEVPTATVESLPVVSDNGVVRLESDSPLSTMTNFATNWTKGIAADFDINSSARMVYQLWPNPYMIPYLDGEQVLWSRSGQSPAFLTLSKGHHHFELLYKSGSSRAFSILCYLFVALYLAFVVLILFQATRKRRFTA